MILDSINNTVEVIETTLISDQLRLRAPLYPCLNCDFVMKSAHEQPLQQAIVTFGITQLDFSFVFNGEWGGVGGGALPFLATTHYGYVLLNRAWF